MGNRILKYILPLITLTFQLTVFGQFKEIELIDFKNKIFEIEKAVPEGENYSYSAQYLFFETDISLDTTLSYDFNLVANQKEKELDMLQFGRYVTQNSTIQIVCDTTEKQLIIKKSEAKYFDRKISDDYALLLQSNCKAFKRNSGQLEVFRLEFPSGATYSAIELWINNSNLVEKYVTYTDKPVIDDSGDIKKVIKPRLEIHYDNYLFGSDVPTSNMKGVSDYFIDFKTLTPINSYQEFEIIDLRN